MKALWIGGGAAAAIACLGVGYGYAPSAARPAAGVSMVLEISVRAEPSLDPRQCAGGAAGSKVMTEPEGIKWAVLEGGLLCRFRADGTNEQQWRVTGSRTATHKMQAAGGRIHFSRRVAPFAAGDANNPEDWHWARQPCSASPLAAAMLADSYVQAGTPLAPCRTYRSGNIILSTDTAPTEPLATPLLRFHRSDAAADGKTILYLTGGPFSPALQGFEQSEILKYLLMERSDVSAVIVPLYAGTSYTYLEGVGNFDVGIAQAAAILRGLQADPRSGRVCVVGGSLGGRLGAHLARQHPDTPFLLVNPLIWSPEDLRAAATKADPAFPARTVALRRVDWGDAQRATRAAEPLAMIQSAAFADYFGPRYGERLGTVLGSGAGNVSIAYSALDNRIGVASIAEVKLPPERVAQMPGVGHDVAEYVAFWAFQPHLQRFVDTCGKAKR